MKRIAFFLVIAAFFYGTFSEVISREENFEFAVLPALTDEGDRVAITFTTQGRCDVTITVKDRDGGVIRHLASGVLGSNAPAPFMKDTLFQRVYWDKKDNRGNTVTTDCKIFVSLGLGAEHEMDIGWKPVEGAYITKDGKYFRTLFPPPADAPESVMGQLGCSFATTIWGDRVPYGGWFSVLASYSNAANAVRLLTPAYSSVEPPRRAVPYTDYTDTMIDFKSYRMAVDPFTEDLYVGIGSPNVTLYRISGSTGVYDKVFRISAFSELAFGPDSLLYIACGPMGYGRYIFRMTRDRQVVPFTEGSRVATLSICPDPNAGWWNHFPSQFNATQLAEVLVTGVTSHSNIHEKGFDVSPSGRMVGVFDRPDQVRDVKMWTTSGQLLSSSVVNANLEIGHGVRMDRDNSLYLVYPNVLPSDQTRLDGITDVIPSYRVFGGHGSLVKFADRLGLYPLDFGDPLTVKSGWIASGTRIINGPLWVYGGMTDAIGSDCTCHNSRFDQDGWARSWIPARQLNSLVVIDANGNRIARIGRYGNVDDEGIRFAWVRAVAVSDKYVYANDVGNNRILKAKITYENEVVLGMDGSVSLSPGTLIVTARDAVTGAPVTTLSKLTVSRSGSIVDTVSSRSGTLKLAQLDSGSTYQVSVAALGYQTASANSVIIEGSKTTRLTLNCVRKPLVGIDIRPDTVNMLCNASIQLTPYGVYADGAVIILDSATKPVWLSREPSVVSVGVTGLVSSYGASGNCFVVSTVNGGNFSDSTLVKVVPAYKLPKYHWKLDEGTGVSAADACGSENTGTLQGGATWVSGRYGSALSLNGSTGYLSTAVSEANPSNFTLSLWFKTTSTSGGVLIGFANRATGQSTSWDRDISITTSGALSFRCYPGRTVTVTTTGSYNDGNWHFVAATLSSSGMLLYVDGVLAASDISVTTAESYTGFWKIGYNNSQFFSGELDDIRVYAKPLLASEIALLKDDSATVSTRVNEKLKTIPEQISLLLSPNPFNPTVKLTISGWKEGFAFRIMDISGKVVSDLTPTVVRRASSTGMAELNWDGRGYAPGLYIFVLKYGSVEIKKKGLLVK